MYIAIVIIVGSVLGTSTGLAVAFVLTHWTP